MWRRPPTEQARVQTTALAFDSAATRTGDTIYRAKPARRGHISVASGHMGVLADNAVAMAVGLVCMGGGSPCIHEMLEGAEVSEVPQDLPFMFHQACIVSPVWLSAKAKVVKLGRWSLGDSSALGDRSNHGCPDTGACRFCAFFPAFLIPEQELAKMQKSPGNHGTSSGIGRMCHTSQGNVA